VRRRNLGILLFAIAGVAVVLLGLSRSSNNKAPEAVTTTTVVGVTKDLSAKGAFLQPADDTIAVAAGTDCRSAVPKDPSPSCGAFQVGGVDRAWTVEQDGAAPPTASFLRRDSPTSWHRLLMADGRRTPQFDSVNVRVDDITGDGEVEAVYGFHHGDDLFVDVVDADGSVLLHLDLGAGQILVGGGQLITYVRRGPDTFERTEIALVKGKLGIQKKEQVKGPASGNL
jgi:hypothetical protein